MTCRCKFEFCYKCGGIYRQCECMNNPQPLLLGAPIPFIRNPFGRNPFGQNPFGRMSQSREIRMNPVRPFPQDFRPIGLNPEYKNLELNFYNEMRNYN